MKKTFYAILTAVILFSVLFTACGNKGSGNLPDIATPEITEAPTEEPNPFRNVLPENGQEVLLVHEDIYKWYSSYKTPDDYFSSMKITEAIPHNYAVPVLLSWTYPDNAEKYIISYGYDRSLSDCITVETEESSYELQDLYTGTEYFWQITAVYSGTETKSRLMSFKTADTMRLMNIPGLENARDLGGLQTRFGLRILQGKVYRTANTEGLKKSNTDLFTERYGIKTEIDLRYLDEIGNRKKSVMGPDVNYISVPSSQYLQLFWNSYPGSLKKELKTFADENAYPIDFHCVIGRDRTGTLAALIYALCGVDEVSIVRDYEASYLKNDTNKSLSPDACEEKLGIYFLPFLEQLKRTFGTDDLMKAAEKMAQYTGLTAEEINAIRRNLLGPGYKDQEIEPYSKTPEAIPESDKPYLSWEGGKIATDLISKCYRESIGSFEPSSDGTYTTVTAKGTEGCIYYIKGNIKMSFVPVIAIKYRTSDMKEESYFEVFADSSNQEPSSSSNTREPFIVDGQWHVAIINMADRIKNFNGTDAKTVRLDLYNKARKGLSVDYSFIGFFTSEEAAYKYFNMTAS